MSNQNYQYLLTFIETLQKIGRYTFSIEELRSEFIVSQAALQLSLNRLIRKNRIVSVHRGFYVIVPPEYQASGILPTDQFINDLMHYLKRPYYIGLLEAAAMHGAAHQQPQESYVVTVFPNMRPLKKNGLKINFITKTAFPKLGIEDKKTVTGYFKISNPVLTAYDLVYFEKRAGGMTRVAEVLSELAEIIKPRDFQLLAKIPVAITAIQRLGYLLEYVVDFPKLSALMYNIMSQHIHFQIPLSTSKSKLGFPSDNRWKVTVNTSIELDI